MIYENQIDFITHIIEDANSTLYALVDTKLLISEDGGISWFTRTIPESDMIVADHSGRIYRNAGIGVQYSSDKGITWIPVDNSGLNNWVNEMAINQNNRIYLATTSGVYFGEGDSIVVSVENTEPAKTFFLSQNYPNPFNPVTKIKYSIPQDVRGEKQEVMLKIYDVLGREIATLVNEEKPAGEYEVEFDGSALPSGIYFYRLKAGAFSETRKMVLLK
ncbi:MAG: T9SS type A sorting domain-containing protein [bacterium]|nr:T9SS type A sorting domain-containing protein [bacterium]